MLEGIRNQREKANPLKVNTITQMPEGAARRNNLALARDEGGPYAPAVVSMLTGLIKVPLLIEILVGGCRAHTPACWGACPTAYVPAKKTRARLPVRPGGLFKRRLDGTLSVGY